MPGEKIQLAIQGGGAKICDLLAAAEVVQELVAAGELQVTRVAGTSAGAIVACMIGAGKTATTFKETLVRQGNSYLATIVPTNVAKAMLPNAQRGRLCHASHTPTTATPPTAISGCKSPAARQRPSAARLRPPNICSSPNRISALARMRGVRNGS